MVNESLNPYAPPETESSLTDQPSAYNPEANLEILRLAVGATIIALFSLCVFPAAPILAPFGIYQAQQAKKLIDQTGAGLRYEVTATGAQYICYLALLLFVGFVVMLFL